MSDPDYYKILGVDPTATDESIRKQYKKLARAYHPNKVTKNDPDKVTKNATKFKELVEAYEVLIDKDLRSFYNNHGKSKKDVQTYKVNKEVYTRAAANSILQSDPWSFYKSILRATNDPPTDENALLLACALASYMIEDETTTTVDSTNYERRSSANTGSLTKEEWIIGLTIPMKRTDLSKGPVIRPIHLDPILVAALRKILPTVRFVEESENKGGTGSTVLTFTNNLSIANLQGSLLSSILAQLQTRCQYKNQGLSIRKEELYDPPGPLKRWNPLTRRANIAKKIRTQTQKQKKHITIKDDSIIEVSGHIAYLEEYMAYLVDNTAVDKKDEEAKRLYFTDTCERPNIGHIFYINNEKVPHIDIDRTGVGTVYDPTKSYTCGSFQFYNKINKINPSFARIISYFLNQSTWAGFEMMLQRQAKRSFSRSSLTSLKSIRMCNMYIENNRFLCMYMLEFKIQIFKKALNTPGFDPETDIEELPPQLYNLIFYVSPTRWFHTILYKNDQIGGVTHYLSKYQPEAYTLFQTYNKNRPEKDIFSTLVENYDRILIKLSTILKSSKSELVPLLNNALLIRRRIDTYRFREKELDNQVNKAVNLLERYYPDTPPFDYAKIDLYKAYIETMKEVLIVLKNHDDIELKRLGTNETTCRSWLFCSTIEKGTYKVEETLTLSDTFLKQHQEEMDRLAKEDKTTWRKIDDTYVFDIDMYLESISGSIQDENIVEQQMMNKSVGSISGSIQDENIVEQQMMSKITDIVVRPQARIKDIVHRARKEDNSILKPFFNLIQIVSSKLIVNSTLAQFFVLNMTRNRWNTQLTSLISSKKCHIKFDSIDITTIDMFYKKIDALNASDFVKQILWLSPLPLLMAVYSEVITQISPYIIEEVPTHTINIITTDTNITFTIIQPIIRKLKTSPQDIVDTLQFRAEYTIQTDEINFDESYARNYPRFHIVQIYIEPLSIGKQSVSSSSSSLPPSFSSNSPAAKQEANSVQEAKLEEEATPAQEAKLAEEATPAQEAKLADEAIPAQEAQLAEEARLPEEARLAEEAKLAEEATPAQEAKLAEEATKAAVLATLKNLTNFEFDNLVIYPDGRFEGSVRRL